MPSLVNGPSLGTGSASSLLKSASSLATAIQNYQDQVQALEYANSGFTDEAYNKYTSYLNGRVKKLNTAGGIINASKALTLTKTMEGATHNNTSASILRENIQIMAGNATPTDKYNVIVRQYRRAVSNGDFTLAQSLENQAYSLSQTIQQQAQQAADAGASLAKAAGTGSVSYQNKVVDNLKKSLGDFKYTAMHGSERELNADLAAYANDPGTKKQLQALGVKINGSQPNYWDVVSGVAGAIYNHMVLRAQAESAIDPIKARTFGLDARAMLTGQYKFDTLAGRLTVTEIQQAQQDPNMFSFNNTKGTYERNISTGYQYMTFTNEDGSTRKELVPTYSNYALSQRSAYNRVFFLTPQETTAMTKLGLDFTENFKGKSVASTSLQPGQSGSTGNGVQVQITKDSPDWLKSLLGEGGISNFFTDNNGFLTFEAGSTKNKGPSYYTLATDDRGLSGVFEHSADGNVKNVGGDYGFNASAVQLLVNKGERLQTQIVLAQQEAQKALQVKQQQAIQKALKVSAPTHPTPQAPVQHTVSPQLPTFNPQGRNVNPQPKTVNPQGTINGFNLNQSGSGGIRLGNL